MRTPMHCDAGNSLILPVPPEAGTLSPCTDEETAKEGLLHLPRGLTGMARNDLFHSCFHQRPPPPSSPGLYCVHPWLACSSWSLGLFWSSSLCGADAGSTGPSGCHLALLAGLGPRQLPAAAGPRWARTASASSESEEEPRLWGMRSLSSLWSLRIRSDKK